MGVVVGGKGEVLSDELLDVDVVGLWGLGLEDVV